MAYLGMVLDGILIVGLAAGLISGRMAPASLFFIFSLAAMLTGRISFETALDAAGSPSIWAVVSLVVFSLALTKIASLRRLFFRRTPAGLRGTLTRLLGVAAATSAVVPNTAVVAALLGPSSRRPDVSAHQLLLPLSYMCLVAGMMTPFGTSASLMTVGQADLQGVHLGPLDFILPGLAVTMGVFLLLTLVAPRVLRESPEQKASQSEAFFIEGRVEAGSVLAHRTVADAGLRSLHSFYLAEVIRQDQVIAPARPSLVLQPGDLLIFVGDIHHMDELQGVQGLSVHPGRKAAHHLKSYRAVVSTGSVLVGRTLKTAEFRARFDASVLGIQRADETLSGKLGNVTLQPGDLLLLAAGPDFHRRKNLQSNLHLLDADDTGLAELSVQDTVMLAGAFVAFLATALFQLAPIALAALCLAGVSVLLGWVSPREARRNFPFDLAIVLWGAVLLSRLVQQSGLSELIADWVAAIAMNGAPFVALAAIFFMAWMMTEFFSNISAALIALPIGLDTANALSMNPEAFALAAAFGASASFFMPFGYQTHLMVLSPGRYRLGDFLKLGSLVFVTYSVIALTVLSWVWL